MLAGRSGIGPTSRQMIWGLSALALAALPPVSGLPGGHPALGASAPGPSVPVIVQYDGAALASVQDAIGDLGGRVARRLDVISAVSASVPQTAMAALRSTPGVRAVTEDSAVALKGTGVWQSDSTQSTLWTVRKSTRVSDSYFIYDAKGQAITGKGIGVALIDSGVTPVTGLMDTTRIVNGPDLSFESQAPNLRYLDTFGHGTHMAGIIAGRDAGVAQGAYLDRKRFVGVAPDSTLVSVKVASADGATDVSQVIAAIDWVVQHRNDPGLNIRVLNLSFGTDSGQDPRIDPLSHAVEAAWRNGIVVVAAAGNDGPTASRLTMPALNPNIIAVGASDTRGNDYGGDDYVAKFSSRGNATRGPDLLAPGRSIMALRDPGSYIDVNYPSGLVSGDADKRYFKGSGTSQAAAVMSGAAALVLQHRPTLTPDQVKKLLTSTAYPLPTQDKISQGAGVVNVEAALKAPAPAYTQTFAASTGTGSLELSRGSAHVADSVDGVELTGETDIMGRTWSGATWAPDALLGRTWSGGTWNGSLWTGGDWTGSSWTGRTWSGEEWTGRTWSGRTWSGRTWSDAVWTGRTWSGRTWSGRTWSGTSWTGGYWSGAEWK